MRHAYTCIDFLIIVPFNLDFMLSWSGLNFVLRLRASIHKVFDWCHILGLCSTAFLVSRDSGRFRCMFLGLCNRLLQASNSCTLTLETASSLMGVLWRGIGECTSSGGGTSRLSSITQDGCGDRFASLVACGRMEPRSRSAKSPSGCRGA